MHLECDEPIATTALRLLEGGTLILSALIEADRERGRLERLEHIVYNDALTGLSNRRKFDETMATEWSRHRRDGSELTLLMLDVDYFKVYNDTYGHQSGDRCLASVAAALRACVSRPSDLLARYGGEEFVVVLPSTGLQGGITLAERLREAVAAEAVEHSGSTLNRVSISIGVACAVPALAGTAADLVERADAALYRAKLSGRNRAASDSYESDAPPAKRTSFVAPYSLPETRGALLGRLSELRELQALLDDRQLVTIVAFGGIGKTRLAIEAASAVKQRYPDGVRFIDLSPINAPDAVAPIAGAAFGIQVRAETPLATAFAALQSKKALIVLDNCEHVRAGAAAVATAFADAGEGLRVLATSREAFAIPGESVFQLGTLPLPAAVELFAERASAIKRGFSLDEESHGIVERLCRELECIPLAIELAAPKLRVFSLRELASKLGEHVRLLGLASHEGSARQQTIRALIEWSVETLTPAERLLFRRLGVFAGGWNVEAASAICTGDGIDSWDVLELLIGLADKSLVFVETARDTRYRMLAPLREFAREQLRDSGESQAIEQRHLDYYVGLVESADGAYWLGESTDPFEDPVAELENARAALEWGLERCGDVRGGARLAGALARFWFFAKDEGRRWVEMAADSLPPGEYPAIEARLDLGFAQLETFPPRETRDRAARAVEYYRSNGEYLRTAEALYHLSMTIGLYYPAERALAHTYASESLELSRRLDVPRLLLLSLRAKAQATEPGAIDARRALLQEGLELAQNQADADRLVAVFLMSISELEFEARRYDDAIAYGRRAVKAAELSESLRLIILTKSNLAHYAFAAGEYAAGRSESLQAIQLAKREEDEYSLTLAVHAFAAAEAADGDPTRAAYLIGFCDARFATKHAPRQNGSCEDAIYKSVRESLAVKIGTQALEEAAANGAKLSKAEAIALVLKSGKPGE